MLHRNEQKHLTYEVAGVCVLVNIPNPIIRKRIALHYKDYLSCRSPDVHMEVKYSNVLRKPRFKSALLRNRSWELGKNNGHFILHFPAKNRSSIALFKDSFKEVKVHTQDASGQTLLYLLPELLFSFLLPSFYALLVHGCGVVDTKQGYLFIASSSGGKSTIAELALKNHLTVLNDDRIIIRKKKDLFKIYGNPWHGKIKKTSNRAISINRVYFLKKAAHSYLKPMDKREAFIELYKNIFYIPIDDMPRRVFNICSEFITGLDCYQLGFKPNGFNWEMLNELAE